MAWNPEPKVAAARDFGEKFKSPMVVILSIDVEKESICYVSYGKTRALCDTAKEIAGIAQKAIEKHFEDDEIGEEKGENDG